MRVQCWLQHLPGKAGVRDIFMPHLPRPRTYYWPLSCPSATVCVSIECPQLEGTYVSVSWRILYFGFRWHSVTPAPWPNHGVFSGGAGRVGEAQGSAQGGQPPKEGPDPWVFLQPCFLQAACCCPCCTSSYSGRFAWLSQGWVGKWMSSFWSS